MRHAGEEPDYLAGTQLPYDPGSFERVVKEVFLLEHDCIQNQDLAETLGVDKSRISQIFANPSNLKPETIHKILSKLRSKDNQQRIVQAWMSECFGKKIGEGKPRSTVKDKVTENIIVRIDRMVRETRLQIALQTVLDARRTPQDLDTTELLLDRAYFLYHRSGQPGKAMSIAREMAERARQNGFLWRQASALYLRARIMIGLFDSEPQDVMPVLDEASQLLKASEPVPSPEPEYIHVNEAIVENQRHNALLTFMERDKMEVDARQLAVLLKTLDRELEGKPIRRIKHGLNQLKARIHLLLGQTFAANEALDASFDAGGVKNLNAYENAGLVKAMIMSTTEEPSTVAAYLSEVIDICSSSQDHYHRYLAEHLLARTEVKLFPPSRPVF